MAGLCMTKIRYLQIRPKHALEECDQKFFNFRRDRMLTPVMLILGWETYHNLCIDLAQRYLAPGARVYPQNVPKVTGFNRIPFCVDDEECWGVRFLPPMDKAWPQYGKDDQVDHWRPGDVAEDPIPDSPSIQTD